MPERPGAQSGGRSHLLTVGHSNRALQDFIALLAAHGVGAIADVRRLPASRRHPHFAGSALERSLGAAGIGYLHIPELGGMREPLAGSPHTALAEGAFRGYADHMASAEFARGVTRLLELAAAKTTAAMCAEADPKHCHRSLLADALLARGSTVAHILDAGTPRAHELHRGVRIEGGAPVYDGAQRRLPL